MTSVQDLIVEMEDLADSDLTRQIDWAISAQRVLLEAYFLASPDFLLFHQYLTLPFYIVGLHQKAQPLYWQLKHLCDTLCVAQQARALYEEVPSIHLDHVVHLLKDITTVVDRKNKASDRLLIIYAQRLQLLHLDDKDKVGVTELGHHFLRVHEYATNKTSHPRPNKKG